MALRVEGGHGCYSRGCEPEFPAEFRQGDLDSVGRLLEEASKHADKTFPPKEANAYLRVMCNVANKGLAKLNEMPATRSALLDRARCLGGIAAQMDKAGDAFEQRQAASKHQTKEIEEQLSSEFPPLADLECPNLN
ncbi:MAG: hypothetical protein K2X08_07410 [Chlamydiales bacterium]|nr:hypothetical protein [Chlamydiales bacterium]